METSLLLKNHFEGQIKDMDEIPAVPPTFKRKENKEYQQLMEKFTTAQKKIFSSWRESDKGLQNLSIMNIDKYHPLGFNISKETKEIFIKDLKVTLIHENNFIKLKIASKICIYNYIIFLGEDANKDLIPVIIYDTENYYSFNLDNWDNVQEFYKEGKYILIINPNYTIYDAKMYETEGIDGLLCRSPNETILFKDESDLNKFFNLLNLNNNESFKKLGDIMIIRKYYDKAIYFYENAIKAEAKNFMTAKIYSLLCECYIRYPYYTKGLDYIEKCFNLLNYLIEEKKENNIIDKTFILTSLFRKIKCFIGLRDYKKAYELLIQIKEDKEFQNYYILDEDYVNKFINEKNNSTLIEIVYTSYNNSLGKYDIQQILNDEKKNFFLDNGDYINPKLEISFDQEKGVKILAKADINIGEYILVEKAIYCCRTHDPNNNFETDAKLKYPFHIVSKIEYIDCINHLTKILKKAPLDHKEFFVLYNGQNLKQNYESRLKDIEKNISNLDIEFIEEIFKLNWYKTFRYFYSINKLGVGIWNYFSLLNHSCLPNTTNYGIGDFIFVIPNRLIKKGEEITVLYLMTPKYYESRKYLFKDIYNFECNCILCQTEKNNRINNPDILLKYDEYIQKIISPEVDTNQKFKILKDFPKFLEKNKNILSGYEIGKGYLEMSSCCPDFNTAYQYYILANKALNDDFEARKINLNKIIEFADSLIKQGDKSVEDIYKKLFKTFVNFHKSFYNFKENEIELLIKINQEQKFIDLLIQQAENLELMKIRKQFENNKKK